MSTVKRDISMSIIADTRRYQAEMAKIPGMTDKAAAKAAERMVKQEQKRIAKEERLREKAAKDQEKLAKETGNKTAAAMKAAATAIAAGFTAAAAAGAGLITLGQDIADTRNELSDMSVETGISADTLAALRFGANAAGKDLGNLTSGLSQFSKRMVQAEQGTGALGQVFAGLGVQLRDDVSGELRSADDVFRQTVQALASVEDEVARTDAALELFGKSGGQLVNVTQVLGGDFDLFAGAVDQVGLSMGEGAQESADFQRSMAVLAQVLDGLKEPVGALALNFAQGLAGGIMLAKVAAMTSIAGFQAYAASFTLIADSIRNGTIPSLEELKRAGIAAAEPMRAEVLAEVDAFRALIGSVQTTSVEVGDLSGLMDALTKAKDKDTKSTKANTDAEKTAAQVSKDLERAKLDQMDATDRLVAEHGIEARALQATIAKGADAAEVAELQALRFQALQKKISDLNRETATSELEAALVEPLKELSALGPQIQAAFDQLERELEETKQKNKELAFSFADLQTTGLGVAAGFAELALDDYSTKAANAASRSDKLRAEIEELRDSMTDASKEERAQIEETIKTKEDDLDQAEKRRKKQSRLARATFKEVKALRIAEATISGAAAAVRALAELGPIAGAVAASGIAATTALNIATIKRQKAPKFHQGGMIEPDETPAILRRGEAVLSERATQRLGRQTIEALNRDEPLGAVNIYLGDDLLRSQRLTRAPRGGTHTAVGARSPYLGR